MREAQHNRKRLAAVSALAILSLGLTGAVYAPAQAADNARSHATVTHTKLHSINDSGVTGKAMTVVQGRKVTVRIKAKHLVKNMPHAMHFHFAVNSDHDCPTYKDDANNDHRITTTEGGPSYGAVQTSLTTKGDTSAGSALAVDRFPTAGHHKITYKRSFKVSKKLAHRIERGKVAVVIHGVDYNNNGKYDFEGAGKSDLDPNLPAEATDPAACGVLKEARVKHHNGGNDDNGGLLGGLL